MEFNVSNKTIEHYRKEGFVHIPQVLNQQEVDLYLQEACEMFKKHQKVSWDEKNGNVMDWVADAEIKSKVMRKLVLHKKITTIAEKCAGSGLRLLKSELLLKRNTGSSITPIHIDAFAFPVADAPNTLTVWVALTDVPVEMGALTFIPGSHKIIARPPKYEGNVDKQNTDWSEEMLSPLKLWPALNWMPRITVPLRAGDCTIHHAKTVHLAEANNADNNRISLTTVYTDIDAKYDAEKFEGWNETEEDFDAYQAQNTKGLISGQPLPDKGFPKVGSHLKE